MEELLNLYPRKSKGLSEDNYGSLNGFLMAPREGNEKWGSADNVREEEGEGEEEAENDDPGREGTNFDHAKEADTDDGCYGEDGLYDNGNDKNNLPFDKKKHERLIKKICYRNDLKYYNYYINNFEKIRNIKGIRNRGENRICVLILCLNYIYCNLNNEIMTIHELKRQIKRNITKTRVYCKNLAKILFMICGKLQIRNFTRNDILPYMEKCITTIIKRLKFLNHNVGRETDLLHVSRKANIFDEIFDFINNGSSDNFPLKEEGALFREVTADGVEVGEISQSGHLFASGTSRNIHGEEPAHERDHAEEANEANRLGTVHDRETSEGGVNNVLDISLGKGCPMCSSLPTQHTFEGGIPHAWMNHADNTCSENCSISGTEGRKRKSKAKRRKNEKDDANERKRRNTMSKEVTKNIDKNVMIEFLERNVTLLSLYSCVVYSIFIVWNRTENMDTNLYNKENRKCGGNLHYLLCSSIIITFDVFNIKIKDQFVCYCLSVVQQTIATGKKKMLKFFLTTFSEFLGLDVPSIQAVPLFMRILFSNYVLLQMYLFYIIQNYQLIKKEGFLLAMEKLQIFLAKLFGTIHQKFLNVAEISVNYDLFVRSDWVSKNVVQVLSQNEDLSTVKKLLKDLTRSYPTEQERKTLDEYLFEESYHIDLNHIDLYIPRILDHCLGISKGAFPPTGKLLPWFSVGEEDTVREHRHKRGEELASALEVKSSFHDATAYGEDAFDYQGEVLDEGGIGQSVSLNGSNNGRKRGRNTYDEAAYRSAVWGSTCCSTTCAQRTRNSSPNNTICTCAHRESPDIGVKKQMENCLEETKLGSTDTGDLSKEDTSKTQNKSASLDFFSSHIKILKKINLQNIHEMNMEIIPFFNAKIVVQFLFYTVLKNIIYNCYSLSFFSLHNLHRSLSTRKSPKEDSRVSEELQKGGQLHDMPIFLRNKIASKMKEMKGKKYTFEKYIICEQPHYIEKFQNCKLFGKNARKFLTDQHVKLQSVKDLFPNCAVEDGANDSLFLDTSSDRTFNSSAVQAEGEQPPLCRKDSLSGSTASGNCGSSGGIAPRDERRMKGGKNKLKRSNRNSKNDPHSRSDPHNGRDPRNGKKIKIALCHYDVGVENCSDCHNSLKEEPFSLFDYIYNSKMMKEYKNVEQLFSRKNFALLFNMFNNMNYPFHTNTKKLVKMNDCLYHTYHLIGIKKIGSTGYSFTYKNELNDNYYKVLKTKICNILSVQDIYFLFNRFFYFLFVFIKSHCCFRGKTGGDFGAVGEVEPRPGRSPQLSQASKVCPCNKANCCYKIKTIVLFGNV
ncbi:hypothetical protein C922_02126 [Plasmodium inui San Antonio 1]|uniref:Uncharacterized protein n=1 Tax=Plasmodium inui San Antonio 1 TaxID=1237626 RepID=W7A6L3_9APIC|nr:hypothetical protein C922_02126 [Plasmodium inui San Antonio 1]EUD67420.1 hypothetical protein C922_02126 [Plasmodium inui San Antonio 1]